MLTFDQKSDNYIAIINRLAEKQGCFFEIECGEGHDLETETIYYEDLSGWLVPLAYKEEFTKLTRAEQLSNKWDKYFCCAEWKQNGERIDIDFVKYPEFVSNELQSTQPEPAQPSIGLSVTMPTFLQQAT
ncbi:MAG: hypothetical protein FWG68_07120 [Defluviitaleaceae bacterium]|nr:hypothetical protein [Defluviitaleaceae bacterium]